MDANPHDSQASKSLLEGIVATVCVARLAFLALLLIPVGLAWFWETPREGYFVYFQQHLYAGFLVTGFGVNIFYLLTWRRAGNIVTFFRAQLVTDIILATLLVVLTGGLRSGFFFLYMGLTFYYGRVLGFRTAVNAAVSIATLLAAIGLWQFQNPRLWNEAYFPERILYYSFNLQVLALGLVVILVRLGRRREEDLLGRIRENEEALRAAETLKSRVFDWMDSGLLVLDGQGRISAVNRQAAIWSGVSRPGEMIGRPVGDYFMEVEGAWKQSRGVLAIRETVERPRGQGWFGLGVTPLPENLGTLILFSDVTRLRELEMQVRQMEKMAALGELAAGLAHEIKNPLAGIKASLQLMTQDGLSPEHEARLSRVVQRDIDRLDHLLKEFLIFARPSEAFAEEVRLAPLVHDCLFLLRQEEPGIDFQVSPTLNDRTWTWDMGQLKQVIMNLTLNAIQAVRNQPAPRITFAWDERNGVQSLLIQDNGPGLHPDAQGRLFSPFFTTKAGGTGLGLAIAQRLAGRNDSWLELVDRTQGGAEARINHIPKS